MHTPVSELDLTLTPDPGTVSIVRRFVEEMYERLLDLDTVSRIALTTHELLENAAKYSAHGATRIRVALEPTVGRDRIVVEVSNHARSQDLVDLRSALDEMRKVGDPFLHYQSVMRRSARRSSGSGLGLARIEAEAEMTLTLGVAEDDEVCLRAEAEVERGTR